MECPTPDEETIKENQQEEKKEGIMPKSEAKRINILLKKKKALLKSKLELARFKEPILLLMRRNNRVEFYEGATKGEFTFRHSNGHDVDIILDTSFIQTFEYGNNDFRGYILHEDEEFPLPQRPLVYAEQYKIAMSKVMNDIKTYKAKEIEAYGNLGWKIAGGIALLFIGLAIYYLLTGEFLIGGGETIIKETVIQKVVTETNPVNKGILG